MAAVLVAALIAAVLTRATSIWIELGYTDAALWYVRGLDGGEVDFLITLDGKPALLIEAKLSDTQISRPARNFMARIGVPLVQVVHRAGIIRVENDAVVVSAERLLSMLP